MKNSMYFADLVKNYKPQTEQEKSDQKVILDYIDSFESNILTRDNRIAHMTSSGLVMNSDLSKILMIHHNIYNTWAWTGGHADGNPNMLDVAIQEAHEETGLEKIELYTDKMAALDILPVYGHIKNGAYVSSHLHLNTSFLLIADEKSQLVVNEKETSGVKWVAVDKLSQYSNEPFMIDIYMKIVNFGRTRKSY